MNGIGTAQGSDLTVTFDSCGADDLFQCAGLNKGNTLFFLHRDGTQSFLVFEKMEVLDGNTRSVDMKLKQ
jgi:hypothetical protein